MFGLKAFYFIVLSFFLALFAQAGTREFLVDKTEGYAPLLVTFDASGIKQAKKFLWSFGDGQSLTSTNSMVSYQYKTPGTYTASLSIQVNASDKNPNFKDAGSVTITVKSSTPVASLACSVNYMLVECNGLASYDPGNLPLTYTFDYGDGHVETNTTGLSGHAYASPGLYNVRLSVFNSWGLSSDATTQVQAVKPPNKLPTLALNCSSAKINKLVCDAIGSSDADGSIISYSYAWDDGLSDSKAEANAITHVFQHAGDHSVTLTAVDNEGGVNTLTKSFSVKANTNPVASFTCDNSKPLKLSCHSTSSDPDPEDSIQSYSWKFGNEVSSVATPDASSSFSAGANVEVSLTVTDGYGGSNTSTHIIAVKENQLPTFDLTSDVTSGIAPLTVHFQIANAVDVDGTIASYNISFGDETTSGSNDVSYVFNAPGTYNVVATVTDELGGTTTKTKQIVVNALIKNPPQAFFKVFEFETLVELHATLTKTVYDIKRAYYTVDGGETVELAEFYPNTINWIDLKDYGQHEITLTVEDIYGQKSSFTHKFYQSEDLDLLDPYVDFTAKQSSEKTAFINLSKSFDFDIDQPIQSFHIDFGDNNSLDTSEIFLTHTYLVAGNYSISVTANSAHGTHKTLSKTITVTDASVSILSPVANFNYRVYDVAQNVSFYNDRSGTPNGSIVSYLWDFGDGSSGTGQKIAHFYDPGSYLVTLTVVDSAGLTSSQTERVTIFGTGSNLIAAIDCSLADPYVEKIQQCQIIALDKQNQISRVRVTWGDGQASLLSLTSTNGIFKPTHKYSAAGTYGVSVAVTTTRGEIKSATTSLALKNFNPQSFPVVNLNCTSDLFNVSCSAQGSFDPNNLALSYAIDWGDSTKDISNSFNFSHEYSTEGSYTVTLLVKNSDGLTNTISKQVLISSNKIFLGLQCEANFLSVSCNALGSYDLLGSPLIYTIEYG